MLPYTLCVAVDFRAAWLFVLELCSDTEDNVLPGDLIFRFFVFLMHAGCHCWTFSFFPFNISYQQIAFKT